MYNLVQEEMDEYHQQKSRALKEAFPFFNVMDMQSLIVAAHELYLLLRLRHKGLPKPDDNEEFEKAYLAFYLDERWVPRWCSPPYDCYRSMTNWKAFMTSVGQLCPSELHEKQRKKQLSEKQEPLPTVTVYKSGSGTTSAVWIRNAAKKDYSIKLVKVLTSALENILQGTYCPESQTKETLSIQHLKSGTRAQVNIPLLSEAEANHITYVLCKIVIYVVL